MLAHRRVACQPSIESVPLFATDNNGSILVLPASLRTGGLGVGVADFRDRYGIEQ